MNTKQKAAMKYNTLHVTPAYDVMNYPLYPPLPLRDPNVRNNYVKQVNNFTHT